MSRTALRIAALLLGYNADLTKSSNPSMRASGSLTDTRALRKGYRRSRFELYLDVLKAIYHGRRAPSRVVYAANLSYDRVMNCINFLVEHDLVERIEGLKKKRYTVTESGKNVVRYFSEIEKHMGRTEQFDTIHISLL